jgi:hypothetical protein
MKQKIFKILCLNAIGFLGLASCNNVQNDIPDKEVSATNPTIYDDVNKDSTSHKLTKPFTIYAEDGSSPENLKYKGEVVTTYTFDDMYKAIRIAGENSTTKIKYQVQDAEFTQIFKRTSSSNWYVFDGHEYVGTDLQKPSKEFIDNHPNSYAILGTGSDYARFGRTDYSSTMDLQDNILELNAGAYNYMFSKTGVGEGEGGVNLNGFSYATANVRLSEMRYKKSTDGDAWNAYIFFNLQSGIHSDLGLIGTIVGDKLSWRLVRNCGSKSHGSAGFYVYQDKVATVSTKYDEKTKEYSGCDDLRFEAIGVTNGWILNITNLRTNEVQTITDLHYESDGTTPLIENPENSATYYRVLVASSYCPVVGNVWNWDSGAATTNVVWDNIKIARYIDDNPESYRSDTCVKYDFYPDSPFLRDGYSQGAFAASFDYGTRDNNGTYDSGNTYNKGDKYLSLSVSYTNEW